MVDGFKFDKNSFNSQKGYQEEWEYKKTSKDLRRIMQKYAKHILGTDQPSIKNVIRNKEGVWANVITLPDETPAVVCRAKKKGGHLCTAPAVLATASRLWAPIIVYVDVPRGNRPWCFYKFSPLRIREDAEQEKGTMIEDGLLMFRLQLGVHVPEQEDQE